MLATSLVSLALLCASSARASTHDHDSANHKRLAKKATRQSHHVLERDALALEDGLEERGLEVVGNATRLEKRGGGYSGKASFFTPGLGACGATSSDSDFVSTF